MSLIPSSKLKANFAKYVNNGLMLVVRFSYSGAIKSKFGIT